METPRRNVRSEPGEIEDGAVCNGQSEYTTTGLVLLDPEDDSQSSLQQLNTESATNVAESVPVTIQEDFLQTVCDNVSTHFPELSFGMAHGIVGATNLPVLLISQRFIHYHPPYGMVSRVHDLFIIIRLMEWCHAFKSLYSIKVTLSIS